MKNYKRFNKNMGKWTDMAVYEIGNYIHDLRVERGYSQEELCFGICSVGNLSKIENGTRLPNRKTVEAFTQRLGCGEVFLQYSSKEEMKQVELCNRIVQKIANNEYDGLKELIDQFESTIAKGDILNSQYCRFTRIMLKQQEGLEGEKEIEELEETLRMTKPDGIDMETILKGLLTYNEIVILINIAINYRKLGQREQAIKILYGLKHYMDTHMMDKGEKVQKYPMILFNLSNLLMDEGKYGDVVNLCDQGIGMCKENNRFFLFPRFLINRGLALLELQEGEQAKESLIKGYCIFYALDNKKQCERLKIYLKENWQIELDQYSSLMSSK